MGVILAILHKFPSIGKYSTFISSLRDFFDYHQLPYPVVKLRGTVKLHGCNCAMILEKGEDDLSIQGRESLLSASFDNYDFYKFAMRNKAVFNDMLRELHQRYPQKAAVVYGEWAGGEIQRKVAVSKLEKQFFVFAIRLTDLVDKSLPEEEINRIQSKDVWLLDDELETFLGKYRAELNVFGVHSINEFPAYEIDCDLNHPDLILEKLSELTYQVEQQCPVAKAFGVEGVGEGIVWHCVSEMPVARNVMERLSFKVKGAKHASVKTKKIVELDLEVTQSVVDMADLIATENRMEQGLFQLKQGGYEPTVVDQKTFTQWMVKDCLKEESDRILASGLEASKVAQKIAVKAKAWFMAKMA